MDIANAIKNLQDNYLRTGFILMDMFINIYQEFMYCFEKAE